MSTQNIRNWLRQRPTLFYMAGLLLFKRHVIQMAWIRFNATLARLGLSLSRVVRNEANTIVVRTFDEINVAYDFARVDGGIHPKFILEMTYEEEVGCEIRRHFKPSTLFIDIGANLGLHSINASKALEHGRVLAVEADKKTHDLLQRNVTTNGCGGRVTPVCRVLWSEKTTLLWEDKHAEHGHNHARKPDPARSDRKSFIQSTTLDELLNDLGAEDPVSVIKVDVEGAELEVLRGAVKTLRRYRPILIVEIEEALLARNQVFATDISEFLRLLGYGEGVPIKNRAFRTANNFLFKHA